jgi:hypothetical protein
LNRPLLPARRISSTIRQENCHASVGDAYDCRGAARWDINQQRRRK